MVPDPLQETAGYVLAQTCKLARARAHSLFEEIGFHRGQHFVLHALWEQQGISHSELAERLHVQPATITNMLKRMERSGLVERRRDTEDERISRVYLTTRGRDVRGEVEGVWLELEGQTFTGFDEQERNVLRRSLLRIQENLMQATVDHRSQE